MRNLARCLNVLASVLECCYIERKYEIYLVGRGCHVHQYGEKIQQDVAVMVHPCTRAQFQGE